MRRAFVFGGVVLLLLVVVGMGYEHIGEQSDGKSFPPTGRLVDINGRAVHVYAAGQGDVTVVFAAGWKIPSPYVDFYPLWSELAGQARAVVYDRPGYGWSQVSEAPRSIDTICGEVHALLEASGEKPPYVLVGHSIGSLEMLRFAQRYRDEVRGIVLIDGSNPDMYAHAIDAPLLLRVRVALFNAFIDFANATGLSRLLFHVVPGFYDATPLGAARNGLRGTPAEFKVLDTALFLRNLDNRNQLDEADLKPSNCATVAAHGRLGNLPLIVVTSGQLYSHAPSRENQEGLKGWSAVSEQVIVPDAGHAVHWSHPEVVLAAIRRLLERPSN